MKTINDDPTTHIIVAACKQIGLPVRMYQRPINPRYWTPHSEASLQGKLAVQFGALIDRDTYRPGAVAIHAHAAWYTEDDSELVSTWLLHEVAHAVMGWDEDLCPAWERDAARSLDLGKRAINEIRGYGDDYAEKDLIRALKLKPGWSLRLRPAKGLLPAGRTAT